MTKKPSQLEPGDIITATYGTTPSRLTVTHKGENKIAVNFAGTKTLQRLWPTYSSAKGVISIKKLETDEFYRYEGKLRPLWMRLIPGINFYTPVKEDNQ